ncbi:hypothetical protein [Paraburkholderia bannensis]|uniref:hypothetical protein n=1 Tax=Paraburkholderia bannensis TaxID=765414 RepID=UPI002ABD58CD|nr:hypothetical protein [Paraburkholderia bannensis]
MIANALLVLLPVLLLIVHGFVLYGTSGRDDVHITYAEATNLSQGLGFTNVNGDRVESGSSILHVVILGGLKFLLPNVAMPVIGAIFSIFAASLSLLVLAAPVKGKRSSVSLGSSIAAALTAYFVYWAFGALESVLAALIVTVAFVPLTERFRPMLFSAALSLYVLVRPEGYFVVALFSVGCLISAALLRLRQNAICTSIAKTALCSLGLASLVFAVITIFRLWYFGRAFPLPVYAKSAGISLPSMGEGVLYVAAQLRAGLGLAALIVAAIVGAVVQVVRATDALNIRAVLAGVFLLSVLSFVVASGGDWMEGGRFLIPIVPLAAYFGCVAVRSWSKSAFPVVLVLICTVSAVQAFSFRNQYSTGLAMPPADALKDYSWFERYNQVHLRDALFLAHAEKIVGDEIAKRGSVVVYSTQAGMVPFYLRQRFGQRFRFVDMRALATDDFIKCSATASYKRSKFGLLLDYADYFKLAGKVADDCGLPPPDVIFDLGNENSPQIQTVIAHGFRVAYAQTGPVPSRLQSRVAMDQVILVAPSTQ